MKNARLALLLMAGVAAMPAAVQAQDAGGTVEEVVVTARRVEESLQTTPVAVTALGTAQLERAQIDDQAGLQRTTPGLVISTGSPGNGGFSFVSIRGQGNLNPGTANDPAVGTYLDGVYIPRPSQGISKLIDLQRVEILRGPQGTLFGRNTTGGAINVLTNDPTGEFDATVQGQYGNYDYWEAGAVVNIPLRGSELGARLVLDHRERSGYGEHVFLNGRDAGDEDSDFVSAKLRYAPDGGNFSVVLAGDYNKITDSGQLATALAVDATATAPNLILGSVVPIPGFNVTSVYQQAAQYALTRANWYDVFGTGFNRLSQPYGTLAPYNRVEAWGGSGTVNLDLGGVAVKSITGYRASDSEGFQDLDGTPIDILAAGSGFVSKQFSQEIQLSGDFGERFNWITGLYYSRETGDEFSNFQTFGFLNGLLEPIFGLPPGGLGAPLISLNDADVKNTSTGAFAQGYYKLTDALRVTAGLRWTWDKRTVVLKNLGSAALPASAPGNCLNPVNDRAGVCELTRSEKFDYPAYTLGLDYAMSDDLFLYAKTSRASKAGGWNLRQGSESTPAFDPETAEDVEAGFKYTTPNRKFRLNAAAFYTWTSDVQRNANAVVNGASTQYLLNAGKTRIKGAEFEATLIPVEGLELTGNLALMEGKYKKGSYRDELAPGVFLDRSDEPLPQLPKTQFMIGATYTIPASFGDVTLHANYAYVSGQYFGTATVNPLTPPALQQAVLTQNEVAKIPSYGLVNGRITLDVGDSGLQFEVFGRNILDKKYVTYSFSNVYSQLGFATGYLGDPATYGVGVRYKFGAR